MLSVRVVSNPHFDQFLSYYLYTFTILNVVHTRLEVMETGVPSIVTTGLIIVSTLFPTLSLISIIFRYKARHAARQSFQADDWWIVVSWVGPTCLLRV